MAQTIANIFGRENQLGNYPSQLQQQGELHQANLQNQYLGQLGYIGTAMTPTEWSNRLKTLMGERKQEIKKIQKTGRLLVELRNEINEWHGDILRAA